MVLTRVVAPPENSTSASALDEACRHSGEQGKPRIECLFEIQLATHGACRDRQNVIRYTGKPRHIVERFRGDDGAVHIGDEKLFLAVVRRNDVHIDAVHIAARAKLCHTVGVN